MAKGMTLSRQFTAKGRCAMGARSEGEPVCFHCLRPTPKFESVVMSRPREGVCYEMGPQNQRQKG